MSTRKVKWKLKVPKHSPAVIRTRRTVLTAVVNTSLTPAKLGHLFQEWIEALGIGVEQYGVIPVDDRPYQGMKLRECLEGVE